MYLDPHQRATVEAAMARIIPTDDAPGAREAGTVEFLDRYLSGLDHVYAKPDGSGFETLQGRRADAWQQRLDIVRDRYRHGIEELDRRSRERFGADFVDLDERRQDEILAAMDKGGPELETAETVAAWSPVETPLQQTSVEIDLDFFPLLALHTRQGFYADPIYGGNRDRVGWQVIGFPGPASLADVHTGRYSVLPYFAESGTEEDHGA
jgi:gluconate 2-dehydrogenase gamma chain